MKVLSKDQMEIRPPWFVGQMFWVSEDINVACKGWNKVIIVFEDSPPNNQDIFADSVGYISFNSRSLYAAEYMRLPNEPDCPPLPSKYIPEAVVGLEYYNICVTGILYKNKIIEITEDGAVWKEYSSSLSNEVKKESYHMSQDFYNTLAPYNCYLTIPDKLVVLNLREEHKKPGVMVCAQCNNPLTFLGGMIPPYCKVCEP